MNDTKLKSQFKLMQSAFADWVSQKEKETRYALVRECLTVCNPAGDYRWIEALIWGAKNKGTKIEIWHAYTTRKELLPKKDVKIFATKKEMKRAKEMLNKMEIESNLFDCLRSY